MTSTFRTLAVLVSLFAVLACCGVAAGSTATATPTEWMTNFCGSVVTWEQTVKTHSKKLQATITGIKKAGHVNLVVVKGKLVGYLGRIVSDTNTLIRKLKAVGAPSTKDGDKLQAAVVSAFGQVNKAFIAARASARKLPTTPARAFAKAAVALGATVQSDVNRVGASFNAIGQYNTEELSAAASSIPACQKL